MQRICFALFLVFVLVTNTERVHGDVLDVRDHGAIADGATDDSKAFISAWEQSCQGDSENPIVYAPSGKTFLVNPMMFSGPCKRIVTVQIDGKLVAPTDHSKFNHEITKDNGNWIKFNQVDGLVIDGTGEIDGQGSSWWARQCNKNKDCPKAPTALVINDCNHVNMTDLSFVNSPQMHIAIKSSTKVWVNNLSVNAPGDSPNTDGIHLSSSQNVRIMNSRIGTGDDCISISSGTSDLHISGINCGPGHGISIGSLGGDNDQVEDIYVRDIHLNKTTNGVRIKTKLGSKGYCRNVVFDQVRVDDVDNPIIIDQFYFADRYNGTTAVKVSNVMYSNIRGTSNDEVAVDFNCFTNEHCTDITATNISIPATSNGEKTSSICFNAQGISVGEVIPRVGCLKAVVQ